MLTFIYFEIAEM